MNASKANATPPGGFRQAPPPLLQAIKYVTTKYRWRLSVNSTKRTALLNVLSGSCGGKWVTIPARAI